MKNDMENVNRSVLNTPRMMSERQGRPQHARDDV